jgi:hypothetical protein
MRERNSYLNSLDAMTVYIQKFLNKNFTAFKYFTRDTHKMEVLKKEDGFYDTQKVH